MGIISRSLESVRANSSIRTWFIILLQCLLFLLIGLYQARADFCGSEANQFSRHVVSAEQSVQSTGNLFKICNQGLIGSHLANFANQIKRKRVEFINLVAALSDGDYQKRCRSLSQVNRKRPGIRKLIDDTISNFAKNRHRVTGAIQRMSAVSSRSCQDSNGTEAQIRTLETSHMPRVSSSFGRLENCIAGLNSRPQFQCN